MVAILLGAGFSRWAANLPIADELFDFDIEPWGPREEAELKRAQRIKHEWDVDNPEGLAEQFIAHCLERGEEQRRTVLWYITRRLSKPFIWREWHAGRWRRHVLMIDENRKFGIDGVVRARDFLLKLTAWRRFGVVTTNYDMLPEYAFGTDGFNYGVPGEPLQGRGPYPVSTWRGPVTADGNVPLAKIHGSVSWDSSARYTEGRRGITGDALIVAPTAEKQVPPELLDVWDLARGILSSSERVLVFGFAFNPYDEAVLDLLRRSGKNARAVLLIDVAPPIDAAQRVWPRADIADSLPPPEGSPQIKTWLQGTAGNDV
ncbi:MAG: hypothetical protein KAX19_04820 [Candidatus Brocadiae bacterium]|nr:hypothetical protein [Candidatus Brocadiia bacterium]